MRAAISQVEWLQPRSLREALRWLHDDPAVPVAGCTDLMVGLNAGTRPAARYLDLWQLDALRGIRTAGRAVRIGALTTWSEIARAPLLRTRLPMLCEAALQIGAVQVQNRGTLGGNIANASPAGDSLPVLAAADAIVEVQSSSGMRRLPFTTFYTGYRRTLMRPDEIIIAVEVPQLDGVQWFRKVGTRAAQSISKVVLAGIRHERPRIALGSVAPTVVRATRAEEALAGGASIGEAQQALQADIHPIDDLRSTAHYRRAVAANLLAQFWLGTREGRRPGGA
jgi:xanthine dehydrogenase small subunit